MCFSVCPSQGPGSWGRVNHCSLFLRYGTEVDTPPLHRSKHLEESISLKATRKLIPLSDTEGDRERREGHAFLLATTHLWGVGMWQWCLSWSEHTTLHFKENNVTDSAVCFHAVLLQTEFPELNITCRLHEGNFDWGLLLWCEGTNWDRMGLYMQFSETWHHKTLHWVIWSVTGTLTGDIYK